MSESFAKVNAMSFSDEPKVIAGSGWSRRRILTLLCGVLVVGVFLAATLFPWWQDRVRAKAERGPNHGFVYPAGEIEVEVIRFAEGRSREYDALIVILHAAKDHHAGTEGEHDHHSEEQSHFAAGDHGLKGTVEVQWRPSRRAAWEKLPAEEGYFGPSDPALRYNRDYRIEIRVLLDGSVLFEGPLWAYSPYLAESKGHVH